MSLFHQSYRTWVSSTHLIALIIAYLKSNLLKFYNNFRLKSIDLVCMKKLDSKVNIIPIIAKADTVSKTELQKFKASYMLF